MQLVGSALSSSLPFGQAQGPELPYFHSEECAPSSAVAYLD